MPRPLQRPRNSGFSRSKALGKQKGWPSGTEIWETRSGSGGHSVSTSARVGTSQKVPAVLLLRFIPAPHHFRSRSPSRALTSYPANITLLAKLHR